MISLDYKNFLIADALRRKSKIKACYSVFDGSIPPLEWIQIINDFFDICITPSKYCAHNLKRNGVKIDCFEIRCALTNKDLLKEPPHYQENERFRFGFIGSNDERKNLVSLIEAFGQLYTKEDNVELYIHSSYSGNSDYDNKILRALEQYQKTSHIIFNNIYISQTGLNNLIKTFHSYIYPQTTTGYFTTPAEMLSYGIPIVISNIKPHQELLEYIQEKDHIFFIDHTIPKPIFHPAFDYRFCGVQFDTSVSTIKSQIHNLYQNRNRLFSNKLIAERKDAGFKLSANALRPVYETLIDPSLISIVDAKASRIKDRTFFMSNTLYQKYQYHKINFNSNISKITLLTEEENDREEKDPRFIAIETSAKESQKIYSMIYTIDDKIKNLTQLFHSTQSTQQIKAEKTLQKIKKYTYKYETYYFLAAVSMVFSLYSSLKRIITTKFIP